LRGGIVVVAELWVGLSSGFDGDVDCDGGGVDDGMGVFGSIWQRTRTSLGLLQRVQFLR
jgi:hypothetical protein